MRQQLSHVVPDLRNVYLHILCKLQNFRESVGGGGGEWVSEGVRVWVWVSEGVRVSVRVSEGVGERGCG